MTFSFRADVTVMDAAPICAVFAFSPGMIWLKGEGSHCASAIPIASKILFTNCTSNPVR